MGIAALPGLCEWNRVRVRVRVRVS